MRDKGVVKRYGLATGIQNENQLRQINSPLDFSNREWHEENGSQGKMPVTKDEFERVGLNNDKQAYKLLNFVYAPRL